jgi:hypothetical protein
MLAVGTLKPHGWREMVLVSARPIRAWLSMAATGACLLAAGCGHPATREECVEIFERSAEIELRSQNITEPEEVRRRTAEARAVKGEELLQRCIGRRITDRAMRCVRQAQTAEELDACLM